LLLVAVGPFVVAWRIDKRVRRSAPARKCHAFGCC
jgi:hypothetical protein